MTSVRKSESSLGGATWLNGGMLITVLCEFRSRFTVKEPFALPLAIGKGDGD